MKTEHKPGQWNVTGYLSKSSGSISIKRNGVWICDVMGSHITESYSPSPGCFPTDIEARANAQLIAAAPDLLANLENIVTAIEEGISSEVMVEVRKRGEGHSYLESARAVLAKAKGE